MGDMEEKLNSLLSDPGAMENIARMVQQLTSGEVQKEEQSPTEKLVSPPPALGKILGQIQGGGQRDDKTQLLQAMKPYLKEERQRKMERALKLAKMARLAGLAMRAEQGGEEDGL